MTHKSSSRWLIYFKERFQVIPNLIIAGGITFSSATVAHDYETKSVFLALLGVMLFLAQLRLMDELKDVEKDKIAHPDRPLPRGLFTTGEFSRFILICQSSMIGFAILLVALGNLTAGIFFGVATLYLYLMFKEFFLGSWLGKRAILYAITHQVIIYPIVFFAVSVFNPSLWSSTDSCWLGTLILGGFFGYEVGRKLDPNAHLILNTYLLKYGKSITALLVVLMFSLSALSGFMLHVEKIVFPLSTLGILSLSILWIAPKKFKISEGLISLYLIIAIWALPIMHLIGEKI